MIYTIYHIPGVKIGCTSQLTKRMRDQGFTDWEILEEHTDIYVASDRELELQKEYGLPVDTVPYWKSVENRKKGFTKEEMAKGGRNGGTNTSPIPGRASKGVPRIAIRKLTFEQAEEIRSKYVPRKYGLHKLGREYGVDYQVIYRIVNNLCYLQA